MPALRHDLEAGAHRRGPLRLSVLRADLFRPERAAVVSRRAGPILLGNLTRPESGCGTLVRRVGALLLLLALSACASAPVPLSLTAMMRMQLRERAGLYGDSEVPDATHEPHYRQLIAWAERHKIIVSEAALGQRGIRGSSQPGVGGWIILIERDIPTNDKLTTLLHELGHIYGPSARTEQEREVIAELVAAMVCQRLGLDVWPQSASYLAGRVPDLELQTRTVQREGVKLDALVAALTKAAGR